MISLSLLRGLQEAMKIYDFARDVVFNGIHPTPNELSPDAIKKMAMDYGIIQPNGHLSDSFWGGVGAVHSALTIVEQELRESSLS